MWTKKKKAGTDVWFGQGVSDMPIKKVSPLVPDIFASYTGPDKGLAAVYNMENANTQEQGSAAPAGSAAPRSPRAGKPLIAGARVWNQKSRKAYGICMSLYDQHPINGKISGDPIADSFAICARKNNALMVVADGVNWGEKSKVAARCAVYGAVKFMNEKLFGSGKPIKNTQDAFALLMKSLDVAHETILSNEGGLTTLCTALIIPAKDSKQFIVCIVNVGDSLAYVFSKHHGVREITTGSHDIEAERDIRDAGGALGPVNGQDPELHNLTCSMTYVDPGDILYLTTDGISDNFDPVVTKIAVPKRRHSDPSVMTAPLTEEEKVDEEEESPPGEEQNQQHKQQDDNKNDEDELGMKDGKPEMKPHERHLYSAKEMERIIHEFELNTEMPCSAQELCGALLQHVLKLTDPKRKILENPDLYGKKLRSKERKRRDSEIVSKMSKAPGKLDHASIVAYEVGTYHGNDDEDYEVESEDDTENLNPTTANGEPFRSSPISEKHFMNISTLDPILEIDFEEVV